MPRSSSPAFIEPMAAKVVDALPEGEQWIYEVKFDGYRALLLKDGGHVQIRSRNDNSLTATYPSIAAAAMNLKADSALLDGEIVAMTRKADPHSRHSNIDLPTATTPSCSMRSICCTSMARA